MGFHYYARSITPGEIPRVLSASAPFAYIQSGESESQIPDGSLVLELSRCWRCLQSAFGLNTSKERPCAELVRTPAAHVGLSQGPYVRVLMPAEAAVIASDLEAFLQDRSEADPGDCIFQFPLDSVRPHVEAALNFTGAVAASGQGIVYAIGAPGSRALRAQAGS